MKCMIFNKRLFKFKILLKVYKLVSKVLLVKKEKKEIFYNNLGNCVF